MCFFLKELCARSQIMRFSILPECSLDSEKFCVRSPQKMGFVGPQYIYQRESGGYKFHALAYMFAALHRMSTVEFVCLEHFALL